MKKITTILAASVASVSIAGAEELSISSTFAWESTYVFRGVQLAEEYFAPSVDLSYGGFYAGVWAALPVDSIANEVDFYAGYGFGVGEAMSADVGFTYYTYPDSGDDFFDDVNTLEFYAGLSFDTMLSPAVYVFYDIDLEALTFEVSGGHTIDVSDVSAVDISVYLGYVEPDDFDSYLYYGLGASYSYAFTDNAAFSIGLNWYGADEDYMDGDDNELTLSTSFTAGF